ncbi:hypothetical protein ABFS82_14G124000 [Erythranthe guttata]
MKYKRAMDHESTTTYDLQLPGFRFHPTEEELLNFYLHAFVFGKKLRGDIIGFLDVYKHHPTHLPGMAKIGEREWYFFVPRERKRGSGGRPNRTTENGFWKATGSDRKILSLSDPKKMLLGLRKTLVFYEGRAPCGRKTDWIMNEYRLPDDTSSRLAKEIVLCKIYRKATSLKVLEQKREVQMEDEINTYPIITPSMDSMIPFCNQFEEDVGLLISSNNNNGITLPNEREGLTELHVPKLSTEYWDQESFWTLENLTPFLPMC